MKYYKGMGNVVAESFKRLTFIKGYNLTTKYCHLYPDGILEVFDYFPWDGNSGPCVDWKSTMEASCVHDALCNLVNEGLLPRSLQPMIDQEYYMICVEKGLPEIIARIRLILVRWYQTGKTGLYRRKVYEA